MKFISRIISGSCHCLKEKNCFISRNSEYIFACPLRLKVGRQLVTPDYAAACHNGNKPEGSIQDGNFLTILSNMSYSIWHLINGDSTRGSLPAHFTSGLRIRQ
jgi:hypothetical protein